MNHSATSALSFPRLVLALALASAACGDDSAPADDEESSGEGTSDPSSESSDGPASAESTGATTGEETSSGGPVDTSTGSESSESGASEGSTGDDGPALGDTTNVLCEGALAQLALVIEQNASADPDPVAVELAYFGDDGSGTPLQDFVIAYGAWLGRVEDSVLVDDAFITERLMQGPTASDLIDIETRIQLVMSLVVRKRTDDVSKALPDVGYDAALLRAQWDEAYCYYDGALRAHVEQVDAQGGELDSIADEIQHGFEWGHEGLASDTPPFAIDEYAVKPAKQLVEKNLFRTYDRLVTSWAATALAEDDALAARRAWGLFQLVEDRLAGRNTPGIAIIEAYLTGAPSSIDVADIHRQLDIAWLKRARTYTDQALVNMQLGTSEGAKGGFEGRTYAKVAGPALADAIDDFDLAAFLATYDAYIDAILADDAVAAQPLSDELTATICAAQLDIGIAACTSSDDEPG